MRARLLIVVLAFWALLSWDVQWHHPWLIGAGLVTALGLAVLTHRDEHLGIYDFGPKQALWLVLYFPWLVWQTILAAVRVMRLVWSPRLRVDPHVVEVPVDLKTGTGRALFANSITLTPGTVTMVTTETAFQVHALTQVDAEGVADGDMLRRVKQVEQG